MTPYHALLSIYRNIKQSRFKNKWHTYKRVFKMAIDKTMLIYGLVAFGYTLAAIFISGDFMHHIQQGFNLVGDIGQTNFWMIISIYPLRYIFQSFRQPGIIFTSSEYQLSILPFGLRHIWNIIVVEKWIKRIAIGSVFWLILLFTPLSNTLTGTYILLLVVLDVCMTAPLWRLYQKRLVVKIAILIGALISVGLLIKMNPLIAAVVVLTSIFIWNIYAWRGVLDRVDWGKVTEVSDFKVWKMPFISFLTKVPFKREKRFYVLQTFPFRRKRFKYRTPQIHHRLWHAYIIKNTLVLFKMIGALLVFMSAMAFVQGFIFYIGVAISIYIWTEMSASLFYDRFKSDILEILPWDLPAFRKTFFKWNIYGGLILILPIIAYYIVHFTWWAPMQVLFIICVSVYLLHNKLMRSSVLLSKQTQKFFMSDMLSVIGCVAVVFSGIYPLLSVLAMMYIILMIHTKRLINV